MKGINFTLFGIPQMVGFALSVTLAVALVTMADAHAQRPVDAQYGGQKAPSGPALGAGGVSVDIEGDEAAGGGKLQPVSQKAGGLRAGVPPATGGPMLLVSAGALAALGVGLMLLRRSGRGRSLGD